MNWVWPMNGWKELATMDKTEYCAVIKLLTKEGKEAKEIYNMQAGCHVQ